MNLDFEIFLLLLAGVVMAGFFFKLFTQPKKDRSTKTKSWKTGKKIYDSGLPVGQVYEVTDHGQEPPPYKNEAQRVFFEEYKKCPYPNAINFEFNRCPHCGADIRGRLAHLRKAIQDEGLRVRAGRTHLTGYTEGPPIPCRILKEGSRYEKP